MTKREAWFMAYLAGLQKYAGMAAHPDTDRPGHERAADLAERDANEALKRLEQQEALERFGDGPPPAGCSLAGWANPSAVKRMGAEFDGAVTVGREQRERADKAEAEVERLKAELEAERAAYRQSQLASEETRWQDGEEADDGLARAELEGRAEKAESLLKEALDACRAWENGDYSDAEAAVRSRAEAQHKTSQALTRARQEGFSDGE